MAKVSSGSFTTNASENRSLTLNWSVDSTSISGNYKKIYWSLVGSGSASGYVMAGDFKVVIDGATVYNSSTRIELWNGTKVASGYVTLYHDATGNKKFSASVQASIYEYAIDNKGSGTWELPTIPRYATSVQSLNAKSEVTIKMNWSSDSIVDYIWYSKDNGSTWTGVDVADGKSGSYYISYLTPNTTYQVKTRVRRKDSQLTTDSSMLSIKTYDYPYCNSAPNFTIGDAVTLGFYNPLGRSISWEVLGADNSVIAGNSTTGTSYKGISGDGSVANLYKSIPNAKSGTYKVKITYGTSVKTATGGTYSIRGTEVPTVNSFTYKDNNSTTVAITGNNQHIVQNYSTLYAIVGSATANNGAGGISKYVLECNGKTVQGTSAGNFNLGAVDSSNNVDLKLTVTDTRGLSASKTIKVTMLAHSKPTALVTLERLNNYEDETYLTVDGSVASVNQKNTMAIKYRYKQSGGSYGSYVNINDKQKYTLSLNKNNVYMFNVVVTDAFGSTFTEEYVLNKGVFPLFISTDRNSVGVNCFPNNNNSFEVDGLVSANSMKCKNLLHTSYTESNKLTITATRDDHTVTTGYYCHLEKDKKYTFSCESDATWGGGNGTDTVEVFLLKDKAYDTIISIVGNPKTFTPTASGVYFVRCDVNKNGTTHSFWNFQIEEGTVATEYVEAKQFEYQEQYIHWEHKVGYWFDGKPLYRQIVSLGAVHFGTGEATTGKNINIPHNIANIKDVIKFEDIWCTNKQYRRFPSNYYGNAGWDGHYYCTNTDICFELGSAILNRLITTTTFLYIILYYTKTTD
jgi:hypothetical protein